MRARTATTKEAAPRTKARPPPPPPGPRTGGRGQEPQVEEDMATSEASLSLTQAHQHLPGYCRCSPLNRQGSLHNCVLALTQRQQREPRSLLALVWRSDPGRRPHTVAFQGVHRGPDPPENVIANFFPDTLQLCRESYARSSELASSFSVGACNTRV